MPSRAYRSLPSFRVLLEEGLFQPREPFKWKDYRVKNGSKGRARHTPMMLEPCEFMRRFLLHVLPGGPLASSP